MNFRNNSNEQGLAEAKAFVEEHGILVHDVWLKRRIRDYTGLSDEVYEAVRRMTETSPGPGGQE